MPGRGRVAPNREATLLTRLTLNSTNAHTTYATCSFSGGRQRQFARVLRFCAMAKRDERYTHKEVADALKKQGHWQREMVKTNTRTPRETVQ